MSLSLLLLLLLLQQELGNLLRVEFSPLCQLVAGEVAERLESLRWNDYIFTDGYLNLGNELNEMIEFLELMSLFIPCIFHQIFALSFSLFLITLLYSHAIYPLSFILLADDGE